MMSFSRAISFWRSAGGQQNTAAAETLVCELEEERRVWVRYPSEAQTTLQPTEPGPEKSLQARVGNISRGGIALVVDRYFEPGSLLTIELPDREPDARVWVLAYVVRATQNSDGCWKVGCTFARELSDEDLESFRARDTGARDEGQRAWKRFPCAVEATYAILADEGYEQRLARVLNISASGALLLVTQALETGSLLSLELRRPNATISQTILACVVHRRSEQPGEWTVGCNFIRELSEEELLALL